MKNTNMQAKVFAFVMVSALSLVMVPALAQAKDGADDDVQVKAGLGARFKMWQGGTTTRPMMVDDRKQEDRLAREGNDDKGRGGTSTSKEDRRDQKIEDRMGMMADRGAAMIDRRVADLQALADRIDANKRLSSSQKANLKSQIDTQIDALQALKSDLADDTSTTTFKADFKTITQSHRIYLLVIPQLHIIFAGDRANDAADTLLTLSNKLETRIDQADADHDVAALKTTLAHMRNQAHAAQASAEAALNQVAGLMPDNGDKTKADANRAALVAARAKIQTAMTALQSARQDASTIIASLKSFGVTVSADVTVKDR